MDGILCILVPIVAVQCMYLITVCPFSKHILTSGVLEHKWRASLKLHYC